MALEIGLRIAQVLDSIGIKMGSYVGKSSNVKKAMFGGKPTMFKPRALETVRGTGGNFDDALKLIEEEAQFIVNATDAEKMNFLNNVNDYKEFGGPPKRSGILTTDEAKNLTDEAKDLETSITDLQTTAQSMKDEATANLKSAEDDLATFFETGGNPLNKKDKKFLGGSMSEEGQIRTGVREFLKKEYKNGRINLDKKDIERVMKYSGLSEDDPILVFKKLYGDEAYKKAGSFPGAFDIGENYNQYEEIFRKNMGEDILKVKDKKYVGDGKLVLTELEEIKTPIKDDDIPFAEGGIADVRVGFVKGKGVTKVKQIIEYITGKFTPMDAMKEVNKVIGKQGKYKNLKLTQKDIDEIVENTEDFIFQRDPDNQFVEGSIKEKTEYLDEDDVLERDLFAPKSDTQVFKDSDGGIKGITMGGDDEFKKAMSEAMEEGMRESENMKRLGLDPTKMEDALKYDEMKAAGQLEKNVTGSDDLSPAEDLMKKYPGMPRKLAEQIAKDPDPVRKAKVLTMVEQTMELDKLGKSGDEIIDIFKKETDRTEQADGGITKLRNGYYGGGQAMVGEDLSQIGHGADALMARNMQLAPNSMATTSTGLNYLLGEDNDTVRVPYNEGNMVLPKPKPAQSPLVELSRIYKTYEDAMPGVSKDTQQYLQQDFIQKLNDAGISQEAFMTYRMQNNLADGGPARKGFKGGGSDASTTSFSKSYDSYNPGSNTASRANKTVDARQAAGQRDADRTNDRISNTDLGREQALNNLIAIEYPEQKQSIIDKIKNSKYNNPYTRGAAKTAAYMYNPAFLGTDLRTLMSTKRTLDRLKKSPEQLKKEMAEVGIFGLDAKKNFEDLVKNTGFELGKNPEADALYDAYRNEVGLNTNPKTINSRTDKFFNSINGDTQYDYNISNSDIKDLITGDSTKNLTVSNMGDTLESRRVTPSGVTSFDVPQPFGDPQSLSVQPYADGGIAGLRKGYVGGGGVNLARRGFLKVLAGTAAGVAAFKTGALKLLGKTATTKVAPKLFAAEAGSGAPAWFEGMVNKVLADGVDITKKAATMDGQVVKSLDTPTGKVDVTIDRTGNVDVNYMGDNTAMGEGVDMRYVVGQADETTKVKPFDEFEAVETIPEGKMTGPDDYNVEFGENATGEVKNLFSDVSELQTLGGDKRLINDISVTLQKKKTLKQMNENPTEFANDNLPDYDY